MRSLVSSLIAISCLMLAGSHPAPTPRRNSWRIAAPRRTRRNTRWRPTGWRCEQRADYVEQDLAVTKDLVLVCLHDESLERTTNVEELFPDRAVVDPATGRKQWLAVDFTLAEIKRLDAGAWFDARFAGERIPTWEEAVAAVGTAAGLYPELKTPALYRARGIDQTALFVESVKRLGLHTRRPAR